VQHLDCGIGDFGPDPIALQHTDLELALIRHPSFPFRCDTRVPYLSLNEVCEGSNARAWLLAYDTSVKQS
jgi:hypothetical protein